MVHLPPTTLETVLKIAAPALTLLGILFALFKDVVLGWFYKPKLTIVAESKPPYAHVVPTNHPAIVAAYIGVEVSNLSSTPAKNVQVFFSGINSEVMPEFKEYRNIPLHLSYTRVSLCQQLLKGVATRWDLAFVQKIKETPLSIIRDTDPQKRVPELSGQHGAELLKIERKLSFDLNPTPTKLAKAYSGGYTFDVAAICQNSNKVFKRRFRLDYDGGWSWDTDILLQKHFTIHPVDVPKSRVLECTHKKRSYLKKLFN